MTSKELYTKGARVWISHPEKVWESGELVENYSANRPTLKVLTKSKELKILNIAGEDKLPPLRNPAILIGGNDLTSLSYLHEPAVLYNLQVRFCEQKNIYTYCGIILVAINPYDELPIYDIDTIQAYRGQSMGDLDPHIFAVAEEAYTKLEREQKNQSIIVSGESGAGKTVSAKYTMRYYASVGGNTTETQIEKKILASSPIIEAFGNAKTTRNDNSSRFGKFIELQFNEQLHICGASMRTYLLEKSRVISQSWGERNYHIFYQLCAAHEDLSELYLNKQINYSYLNQGYLNIDGVDDFEKYHETLSALQLLGFTDNDKKNIFKTLAAILHLGNVQFEGSQTEMEEKHEKERCLILETDDHLNILCDILEVDRNEFRQWLCTRKIVSVREIFLKTMTTEEAKAARDALAKLLYAELFNWLVLILTFGLESNNLKYKFIGVLDIYGFETFESNSFEQFCINYANEKLQQQFNMHVFKLEQEEYLKEGIEWKIIEFHDNQPCIDLIEKKLGILDLLDEECKMPKGNDDSWIEKLYNECTKYSQFEKAKFGRSAFIINHFADKVEYESNGFLEKNRDTVFEEQINVLKGSKNEFFRRLFRSDSSKLTTSAGKVKITPSKPSSERQKIHKNSVGYKFRESLSLLMGTLNTTTPYYIRCIKPNDNKQKFVYNPGRAVQQLRACGVLETIRLSAAGFPSRWTYNEFFNRYKMLYKSKNMNRNYLRDICENILAEYIQDSEMYRFGKNKIFFRASQVAYLEKIRSEKLRNACIIMQKTVRTFTAKKKFLKLKRSILYLQCYGRGYLGRKLASRLREKKAAVTIQRYFRGYIQRKHYQKLKTFVLGIQTYGRGYLARLRFLLLKYNVKAQIIQRCWRGYMARKRTANKKRNIILCQALIRKFLARKRYKQMKIEARSIEHVKALNKGLENKIISLQQKIDEIQKTCNGLEKSNGCYVREIKELKKKLELIKALEIEVKNLNILVIDKNRNLEDITKKLSAEQNEKLNLSKKYEEVLVEIESEREKYSLLEIQYKKLEKDVESIRLNFASELETKLEKERMIMFNEQSKDMQVYQKLLQDYHELEQHCEQLEKQLNSRFPSDRHKDCSDISNISTLDMVEQRDYDLVQPETLANLEEVEAINPNIGGVNQKNSMVLVLKLQHELSEVKNHKTKIENRLRELENSPMIKEGKRAATDALRISELEIQNAKLNSQLMDLQNGIYEGKVEAHILDHLKSTQDEMERKTEEIIQLKSVLASQTENMKSLVTGEKTIGEYINEDGELALAYETQKKINKQLEMELQDEKSKMNIQEAELRFEIERLSIENDKFREISNFDSADTSHQKIESFMQYEMNRIVAENLKCHEQNRLLNDRIIELKLQIEYLVSQLEGVGIHFGGQINSDKDNRVVKPVRSTATVKRQNGECLGMFSYNSGEEHNVMKNLVIQLKPRTAITLLPCLPAYIVFMCIRHTDFVNNEEKVKSIISAFTNSVKKVIKKRHEDFETSTLWFANTLRLLHNMKQYSGEKVFQQKNSTKQNEKCLKNFDLSEYRQVLSDIAVWIYQGLIRSFTKIVQPLIIPAILEHEEIQGISGNIPGGRSKESYSATPDSPDQHPITMLLQEFGNHYKILNFYGVDVEVLPQLFKQMFYFACATCLNNLLLRKDLCHWFKGIQIRHNLSHLEMWIRDKNLDECCIQVLQPIIEAAQLLQARKEQEEDIYSICDMCSSLTTRQICKILSLYAPLDEFEQRINKTFIQKVEAELRRRGNPEEPHLMDINFQYPVRFPFNPSDICLENIEIPEVLNLKMLKKI